MFAFERHQRRGARRLLGPLMAAGCAASTLATPAWAQTPLMSDYPISGRTDDVLAWAAVATSIRRETILIMTPELVVALVRAERRPDSTIDVAVREEVIEPQLAARMGARSLATEVAFDCVTHRRRFLGDVAYPRPDLKGVARTIQEPADWGATREGTITSQVEAAVCAPGRVPAYQPPYQAPYQPPYQSSYQPSAPPRPVIPPPVTGFVVRVGTYSKEANAEGAAAALRVALPPGGRDQRVVIRPISEGYQRLYVVEAQGFADRAQAYAFCQSAPSTFSGCVVMAQKPAERSEYRTDDRGED